MSNKQGIWTPTTHEEDSILRTAAPSSSTPHPSVPCTTVFVMYDTPPALDAQHNNSCLTQSVRLFLLGIWA